MTQTLPPPTPDVELAGLIGQLYVTADMTVCVSCRSADQRDCAAAEQPCCEDCSHPVPAGQVVDLVNQMRALLHAIPRGGVR